MCPRATRFAVATSIQFREPGSAEWRQGRTLNISRTGVLFVAASPLPRASSELECIVALPVFGPGPAVSVLCWGRVARVEWDETVDGRRSAAVTIDGYRFLSRLGPQNEG